MPDFQLFFNIALTAFGVVMGWFVKMIQDQLKDHGGKLDAIPNTYARRDDMKDSYDRLLSTLARIEEKLDRKEDRRVQDHT